MYLYDLYICIISICYGKCRLKYHMESLVYNCFSCARTGWGRVPRVRRDQESPSRFDYTTRVTRPNQEFQVDVCERKNIDTVLLCVTFLSIGF